jgi:hypothetical protein
MDIVQWLRSRASTIGGPTRLDEAADEIERLRELLQQWLGNCFVDTYGQGVTFGMGVKKVWEKTRAALKGDE